MSNFSRTAASLAPAYFHHWRSKSRMSRSRWDREDSSGCPELTAWLATIGTYSSGRGTVGCRASSYVTNNNDVIRIAAWRRNPPDTPPGDLWGTCPCRVLDRAA